MGGKSSPSTLSVNSTKTISHRHGRKVITINPQCQTISHRHGRKVITINPQCQTISYRHGRKVITINPQCQFNQNDITQTWEESHHHQPSVSNDITQTWEESHHHQPSVSNDITQTWEESHHHQPSVSNDITQTWEESHHHQPSVSIQPKRYHTDMGGKSSPSTLSVKRYHTDMGGKSSPSTLSVNSTKTISHRHGRKVITINPQCQFNQNDITQTWEESHHHQPSVSIQPKRYHTVMGGKSSPSTLSVNSTKTISHRHGRKVITINHQCQFNQNDITQTWEESHHHQPSVSIQPKRYHTDMGGKSSPSTLSVNSTKTISHRHGRKVITINPQCQFNQNDITQTWEESHHHQPSVSIQPKRYHADMGGKSSPSTLSVNSTKTISHRHGRKVITINPQCQFNQNDITQTWEESHHHQPSVSIQPKRYHTDMGGKSSPSTLSVNSTKTISHRHGRKVITINPQCQSNQNDITQTWEESHHHQPSVSIQPKRYHTDMGGKSSPSTLSVNSTKTISHRHGRKVITINPQCQFNQNDITQTSSEAQSRNVRLCLHDNIYITSLTHINLPN